MTVMKKRKGWDEHYFIESETNWKVTLFLPISTPHFTVKIAALLGSIGIESEGSLIRKKCN